MDAPRLGRGTLALPSKDNILNVYGRREHGSPTRRRQGSFSWLISQSYDDKGNAVVYDYTAENDAGSI